MALVGGAGFLLIGRDDEPRAETTTTTTAGDGQSAASVPTENPLVAYVTDHPFGELQGDPTFCATGGAGDFAAASIRAMAHDGTPMWR